MHIEGIDEIDNKILDIIKDNARLTYKEIGEQAGISRVSVKTRMDALQEKGLDFDLMVYPDGMHGYRGYQGSHSAASDVLFWRKYLLDK